MPTRLMTRKATAVARPQRKRGIIPCVVTVSAAIVIAILASFGKREARDMDLNAV